MNPYEPGSELHDAYNRAVAKAQQHCEGKTRAGKPCRARPQPGRDFCASHGEDDREGPGGEGRSERPSAATVLVEMAQEAYAFGVSDTGDTFGVSRDGPQIVLMLRGGKKSLRAQLARTYFRRTGKAAPAQALADALLVVEGIAEESEESKLYLRVARHGGACWLDLGDETGRAVRILPSGWRIESAAPVLFKRTALNAPLPEPVPGGDLAELWMWLNVAEPDRPLILAWLIAVLYTDLPHPVLGLFGEQGTAKTTATKVLVQLLDPSPVPARKPPKDADSWVTTASGSWVVGVDNMSDIPEWLSDSICRAVTGTGDVRRKLYTDGDLAVFAFRRCMILNGIDVGTMKGDLAERTLPADLHRIPDDERREEEQLWSDWEKAHPRILGAVLDLAAGVAGVLPSVHLDSKPRMADFARIVAAVDKLLGTKGLDRYLEKQGGLARESLTDDAFVIALGAALAGPFDGTAAELLTKATPTVDSWKPPKDWPSNARAVTQRLRRQAPVMRKAGWLVDDDGGANHSKVIRWAVTPPSRPRKGGESDPPPPQDPQDPRVAGVAGVAGDDSLPLYDDEGLWGGVLREPDTYLSDPEEEAS